MVGWKGGIFMNDWLRLKMINPEIRTFQGTAGTWLLSALESSVLESLILRGEKAGLSPLDIVTRIASEMEEGTLIFAPSPDFPDPRILAFKSIICSREIYWTSPEEGRFILADRFADLLPELPCRDRKLSDRRAVHFLLGSNIRGDWTLVDKIRRVGHGEMLLFTPGEKKPERMRIQRFSWDSHIDDENKSLETLGKALDKVTGIIAPLDNKALMFSGGTDSTLIWACLQPEIPALTGFIDSDPIEMEMACLMAQRHNIEHRAMPVRENEFLDEFRKSIKDTGLPFIISNFQMIFYRQAFKAGFSHLVSGELADSIWGMTHTTRIFEKDPTGPYAVSMERSPLDPGGYGIMAHLLLPDDLSLLADIYGEETILELRNDKLSYTLECLDPAIPLDRDLRKGHADLGSLAFILNGSWRSNYRQAGYAHGVGLSFPFETLSMVSAALSIALPGRILSKNGQIKPLIRKMLKKKLPGTTLPEKSGSGLPRTRFCQEGPFKGFFRERPVPGFWPDERADLLRDPTWESSSLALKCASLSIWLEEVLKNDPQP